MNAELDRMLDVYYPPLTDNVDYRVDRDKLIFAIKESPGVGLVPIRCTAIRHKPFSERFSLWERFMMFVLRTKPGRAEIEYQERCSGCLGHWGDPDQRLHVNYFGDHWPVTAADTLPYNPDTPA